MEFDSTGTSEQLFANLNNLIKDIYTLRVHRNEAMRLMKQYHNELKRLYTPIPSAVNQRFSFPLIGYSSHGIIRSKGKGFVGEKHFDFYDGNAHKGHPALDLFIYDRDQNCIDDRTKKSVSVAAVSDGMIVCTNTAWSVDSCDANKNILRGGKYIFLYSPHDDMLWYYAHLNTIVVHPGQQVKRGDVLGTVGRTGANAMMPRSPTHLHFMMLDWKDDELIPKNPYVYFKK